jgi:hypothetical protein
MLSKEYQNTAQTLRRIAQNMAEQSIVDRLEALASDYERRAEKAALTDKALKQPAARVNAKKGRRNECCLGHEIAKDAAE